VDPRSEPDNKRTRLMVQKLFDRTKKRASPGLISSQAICTGHLSYRSVFQHSDIVGWWKLDDVEGQDPQERLPGLALGCCSL
jgi:hypothetical protein